MERISKTYMTEPGESSAVSRRSFFATLGAAAWAAPVIALAKTGSVEVGVCAKTAELENAIHYGFDYLEPSVAEIAEMNEAQFADFKARLLASPIRCECYNTFFHKQRVVGDDVNRAALKEYMEIALNRCQRLGGSVAVWGSSGSRNVAEGYSRDRAWTQIQEFLRLAGDVARSSGIVIAIEPLRKQESNIINTGAEALRLVREVQHPNVKMIIDFYHLRVENEDPQIVWEARDEIVHFHFANPQGRRWPRDPGEDPMYGRFFELVKKIQFRGGISIEGRGTFQDDAAASVEFFRRELA
ncbi:MAG TPA: sugar phosphate isomerase/epimerase family protein [Terriglobia bacterium]|nr:sugar phosphate isomerase/epimerase family protein [Terriglobia bacterium]